MEKNVEAAEKRKADFEAKQAEWQEIATMSYKICKAPVPLAPRPSPTWG